MLYNKHNLKNLLCILEEISPEQIKKIEAAKPNDIITVYHGTPKFRLPLLINGFDATQKFPRDYNAPPHRGLFITLDLETAKHFAGRGAVLEIEVPAKLLHGTNYGGATGREQEKEKPGSLDWVKKKHPKSFRSYMSYTMTQTSEPQALLIGIVKPSQIKRVWVYEYEDDSWNEYSRKEYLKLKDVYNVSRNIHGDIKHRFEDAEIDLSNPKMSLEDLEFVLKKMGAIDPKKYIERFISHYSRDNGPEYVKVSLESIELGGSSLGPKAIKNLLKQIENAAIIKNDMKSESKISKSRWQKLAGIIKENSEPKAFISAKKALTEWLTQGGKEKLKDEIDEAVRKFYEKATRLDYEPDGKYYGLTEELIDEVFLEEFIVENLDNISKFAPRGLVPHLTSENIPDDLLISLVEVVEKPAYDFFDEYADYYGREYDDRGRL